MKIHVGVKIQKEMVVDNVCWWWTPSLRVSPLCGGGFFSITLILLSGFLVGLFTNRRSLLMMLVCQELGSVVIITCVFSVHPPLFLLLLCFFVVAALLGVLFFLRGVVSLSNTGLSVSLSYYTPSWTSTLVSFSSFFAYCIENGD